MISSAKYIEELSRKKSCGIHTLAVLTHVTRQWGPGTFSWVEKSIYFIVLVHKKMTSTRMNNKWSILDHHAKFAMFMDFCLPIFHVKRVSPQINDWMHVISCCPIGLWDGCGCHGEWHSRHHDFLLLWGPQLRSGDDCWWAVFRHTQRHIYVLMTTLYGGKEDSSTSMACVFLARHWLQCVLHGGDEDCGAGGRGGRPHVREHRVGGIRRQRRAGGVQAGVRPRGGRDLD